MENQSQQIIESLTPKEALNVINQVLQTVSATPPVHTQIQIAFAVLVGVVQENEKNHSSEDNNTPPAV
jgi:hypothetical protein